MSVEKDSDLQEDVNQALKAAFEAVQKKLTSQSDLESLPSKKQAALVSHTDKLGKLKTRVQSIVSGVEVGLNELENVYIQLNGLIAELEDIKENSSNLTQKMSYYQNAKDLAHVLDRLYTVESLQNRCRESEEQMEDVSYFIKEHPDEISVECFKVICNLIDFENELLDHIKASINIQFVNEKFAPVLEAKENIITNAKKVIMSAFSADDDSITTDLLSRAIWIIITNAVRENQSGINKVRELLINSISEQFQNASETDDKQIDSLLHKLQGVLDSLTDKIDIIIAALPPEEDGKEGLNVLDIISVLANEEVLKILDSIVSKNRNSFILSRVIVWLRDYMRSMSHTLGVNPSKEMESKLKYFNNSLVNQIPNDMGNFLDRTIEMELESVKSNREGLLYTPCPFDFQKRLLEAHSLAVNIKLPDLLEEIDDNLIEMFISKVKTVSYLLSENYYQELYDSTIVVDGLEEKYIEYIVASINNAPDGANIAKELAKDPTLKRINPKTKLEENVLTEESTKRIRTEWINIMHCGMERLIDMLISSVCKKSNWDLRPEFSTNFDIIKERIATIKVQMKAPEFRKFIRIFVHQFVAYYLIAYKQPYINSSGQKVSREELERNVGNDVYDISEWVKEIAGKASWGKVITEALSAFESICTATSEDNIILDVKYLIVCFDDLTIELFNKIYMQIKGKNPTTNLAETYESEKTVPTTDYIRKILYKFPDKNMLDKLIGK